MKSILISDDSRVTEMAELSLRLRWPHNKPTVATTATNGLESAENDSPDVVLIHPSYTDMTLSETMRKIREFSDIPVLVLSDQGDEMEAVSALELGADDYVRLPCELPEVMARVWALLRRASSSQRPEEDRPIHSGNLLLNPAMSGILGRPPGGFDIHRVPTAPSVDEKPGLCGESPHYRNQHLGRQDG